MHRWLTVPNLVTVIRLALIVPVMILLLQGDQPLLAAILVVVFSASDWVDGALARTLGQVSRVGEILDPFADRVGITCIGIGLAIVGAIGWWVIIVFLVVDVTVVTLTWIHRDDEQLKVTWVAKARTALIMVGTIALVFGLIPAIGWLLLPGQVCLYVGAVLHVVAGADYLRQLRRTSR